MSLVYTPSLPAIILACVVSVNLSVDDFERRTLSDADNPKEWVRRKRFPPGFFEMMVDWTTAQVRRCSPAKR